MAGQSMAAERLLAEAREAAQQESRVNQRATWSVEPIELARALPKDASRAPEALAFIPSGRPLRENGFRGRAMVPVKRAMRRALAWYVHPIAEDQSRFNASIVSELRRLEKRIQALEPPFAQNRQELAPSPRTPSEKSGAPSGVVHQLVPVLREGDGISGAAVAFRELLRARGHRSEIFAPLFSKQMRAYAQPVERLAASVSIDDLVVYHLSIGSGVATTFAQLPCRKAVYYHNITPAECVEAYSAVLSHHLRWGRADLEMLRLAAELAMAASHFSEQELKSAGYAQTAVVPLPLNVKRLRPRPATPPNGPTLMFVGRFAPHKRQDEVIRVLAALRATHAPAARLVLVGGPDIPEYVQALRDYARKLGVEDGVEIWDQNISDRQLGSLYARSSVYVSPSEHEGFCLPPVEAMAFSVPVLAYAAGGVPETVGDAGVVVDDRDPLVWAEIAWRLTSDSDVRSHYIAAGRERLKAFSDQSVAEQLDAALASIGIRPLP